MISMFTISRGIIVALISWEATKNCLIGLKSCLIGGHSCLVLRNLVNYLRRTHYSHFPNNYVSLLTTTDKCSSWPSLMKVFPSSWKPLQTCTTGSNAGNKLIVGSPISADTSTTQLLHLRRREQKQDGWKNVRDRGPGYLLWHSLFCIWQETLYPWNLNIYSCLNKSCVMTTPVDMSLWIEEISQNSTLR